MSTIIIHQWKPTTTAKELKIQKKKNNTKQKQFSNKYFNDKNKTKDSFLFKLISKGSSNNYSIICRVYPPNFTLIKSRLTKVLRICIDRQSMLGTPAHMSCDSVLQPV